MTATLKLQSKGCKEWDRDVAEIFEIVIINFVLQIDLRRLISITFFKAYSTLVQLYTCKLTKDVTYHIFAPTEILSCKLV